MSNEQARWTRLRASGLLEPFPTMEAATAALVGVQAQILQAAGLALWNRLPTLDDATVDAALHEERRLIKLWGQRGTLHLYASGEWPLIHAAIHGERKSSWRRWIEKDGGDVATHEALIEQVAAMLREAETLGRSELRAADLPLEEWHLSSWGGLFSILVHRGEAVHARRVGSEGRFAHRERWLPDMAWAPPERAVAQQELLRRYFATYGPATIKDYAYWSGSKMAPARRHRAELADELVEVELEGQTMLYPAERLAGLVERPPAREAWPVRLLYRFDPLLLAHRDKGWLVDEPYYKRVWRPAGHIEGTILEHGRIAGSWRYDRKGGGLVVTLRPFAPLPAHTRAPIERNAQGVADYFGLPLVEIIDEGG